MSNVYPIPAVVRDERTQSTIPAIPGISLRDYFAGLALHGLLTCERSYKEVADRGYTGYAYHLADKMLERRGL